LPVFPANRAPAVRGTALICTLYEWDLIVRQSSMKSSARVLQCWLRSHHWNEVDAMGGSGPAESVPVVASMVVLGRTDAGHELDYSVRRDLRPCSSSGLSCSVAGARTLLRSSACSFSYFSLMAWNGINAFVCHAFPIGISQRNVGGGVAAMGVLPAGHIGL
jgi:hypothetical protein